MKLFITTLFVAASLCSINCAQLNNNYLPPAGAGQAGGGPGLQAPKGPGNNALGGISPSFPGANPPPAPNRPVPPSQGRPASPSSGSPGPTIEIISYENVNNGDGSYKWSYESANGIRAEETGDVKNKGSENAIQTVQGSYSYTSPEGQVIQITYTADENGFQAAGDALPTPVPLPEENLRAIAEHEAALATAVPDTAGSSGVSSPGGQRPPSGPSSQPRPQSGPSPPAGTSFGGTQPRPGSPSPPASPGFSNQPRPGGGSGSYSPQSGYKY